MSVQLLNEDFALFLDVWRNEMLQSREIRKKASRKCRSKRELSAEDEDSKVASIDLQHSGQTAHNLSAYMSGRRLRDIMNTQAQWQDHHASFAL